MILFNFPQIILYLEELKVNLVWSCKLNICKYEIEIKIINRRLTVNINEIKIEIINRIIALMLDLRYNYVKLQERGCSRS